MNRAERSQDIFEYCPEEDNGEDGEPRGHAPPFFSQRSRVLRLLARQEPETIDKDFPRWSGEYSSREERGRPA